MAQLVKAALTAASSKTPESRTDRDTNTAITDSMARYKLLFLRLETVPDPNDSTATIVFVTLADMISPQPRVQRYFRNFQARGSNNPNDPRAIHIPSRSTRPQQKKILDASMNFDAKAFNPPLVATLKSGKWADRPLALDDPSSLKDKLVGIYHMAPPRVGSFA